jgi:hypothetical protein
MMETAEIEVGVTRWASITAKEALQLPRDTFLRCPMCGQRVSVHKARRDGGSRDHFEHWPNSGGCSATRGDREIRKVD